jgi:uncharacterized membrane protein
MESSMHIVLTITLTVFFVFIPGFALSLAIFPRKVDLDTIERLGFSFFLGIFPTLFLYFGNKNLTMPINTETSMLAVIFITVASLLVWYVRKSGVEKKEVDVIKEES